MTSLNQPLTDRCSLVHVAPAGQPSGVPEIAEILFPAYSFAIDGGRVSLAGCALEDRLVIQLTYRYAGNTLEIYLDRDGKETDGRPISHDRHLELVPLAGPPDRLEAERERLLAAGERLAAERVPAGNEAELVAAKAVWCKYVEGKLRFTIGGSSLDLPFSGWTRSLAAPPIVCPQSGVSTFQLSATEDGRIAAAERVEICEETGRRMLSTELVRCVVTGRRVGPDLVEACPVTGRRVLRDKLVICPACRQKVSPLAIEHELCQACRRMTSVKKADPRMARVLHEHPALDRWRRWRMSETARVYVLVAAGWWSRLLIVVDKESLEMRHMAVGTRFSTRWTAVEPAQYAYVLRE